MSKKIFIWSLFRLAALLSVVAAALCGCVSARGSSPVPQSFTFVQVCDTQLGMGGYEHDVKAFKQAVRQINAIKPDFVVICGDLVHHPQPSAFADFNAIKATLTMPCYCVPGNHDVGNKPTRDSLARYRGNVGKDYYSFTHKGYRFIYVDTQLWKAPVGKESKAQDVWLQKTLADASKNEMPVFIIGHIPLFAKDVNENEGYGNLPPAKRAELLSLFKKYGVVAVLTGHAHRLIINEYNGIQLVTGQATSRANGSPPGFRLWHVKQPRPYQNESVNLENF